MRRAAVLMLLLSVACDKDERAKALAESVAGDSAPPPPAPPVEAGARPDAGRPPMPERPIPKGQTIVGAGMPQEVQMKAITYMMAMRTPHPDDANADPEYAKQLVEKLKPIVLAMDKGADRRLNRVEMVANGRQIDLLMAGGCDDKAPMNALVQRAGVPFPTLLAHGVLVVRCNDAKIQCLQSVRDVDDVLCTTAPRHK
jgi:hypothetical protein